MKHLNGMYQYERKKNLDYFLFSHAKNKICKSAFKIQKFLKYFLQSKNKLPVARTSLYCCLFVALFQQLYRRFGLENEITAVEDPPS
jgi:hypothetical protein